MKKPITTSRARIVAYLTPEAWEEFTKIALAEGVSLSALATRVLGEWLHVATGFTEPPPAGRGTREDFNPARTLTKALKMREAALERAARKTAKRIEALANRKGR
jgi:hypothetical protein